MFKNACQSNAYMINLGNLKISELNKSALRKIDRDL